MADLPDVPLPRRAFSIDEAIEISGMNRNRLYRLIAEGRLRTFKHGRRRYVSSRALDACIEALEAETSELA